MSNHYYLKEYNRLMKQWSSNHYDEQYSEHEYYAVESSNNPIISNQNKGCVF